MSQERVNPTTIVILLLLAYITYNAKNMNPNQTAMNPNQTAMNPNQTAMNPNQTALIAVWLGFIVFASRVKVFWYEYI